MRVLGKFHLGGLSIEPNKASKRGFWSLGASSEHDGSASSLKLPKHTDALLNQDQSSGSVLGQKPSSLLELCEGFGSWKCAVLDANASMRCFCRLHWLYKLSGMADTL